MKIIATLQLIAILANAAAKDSFYDQVMNAKVRNPRPPFAKNASAIRDSRGRRPPHANAAAMKKISHTLAHAKTDFLKSSVRCNDVYEETCYDDNYVPVSCAKYEDGGCPCPEGLEKCGPSYCDTICCDWETEETCYNDNSVAESCAAIADGGCPCPEGQEKCGAYDGYAGYCTAICCDSLTEETCYDVDYINAESCAPIADGGCPCPEGQEKCGAYDGYAGYCIATGSLCCEYDEEMCYGETNGFYHPLSCEKIADGGCPCPAGQEKCGADASLGYSGYCDNVCCDYETEETCYDENYNAESCAAIADGGCPSTSSLDGLTPKDFARFHSIMTRERESLTRVSAPKNLIKAMVRAKEAAFLQELLINEKNPFGK